MKTLTRTERPQTESIYQKLCEVIPGGVNSPVRSCKGLGQLPMVVDSAYADTLVDVDGHEYIDYCGSWGALIHGHAHPQIIEAATKRMQLGSSFGITTGIEERLASLVVSIFDSIEKIRFVSSGTEATMTAIRLARGYTNKPYIVKFSGHYHGHADFFLVQAGSGVAGFIPSASSNGIPVDIIKQTICLPFNDEKSLIELFDNKEFKDKIAAVILEPIAGNMGVVPSTKSFLTLLRKLTKDNQTLLIFDEVITGFRVHPQGAQGLYGITPDLTTLGKIIGGGFPAAAIGGKKEIMDYLSPIGSVYQAGTLSGNPVAMEAGYQAIKLLQEENFYQKLQEKTDLLTNPIKEYIASSGKDICLQQVGSMFTLFFGAKEVNNFEQAKSLNHAKFAEFFRYMFENGIYIPPLHIEAWFVSMAHKEENLIKTKDVILEFLKDA